jgi:DNA-binding PadR family transcriptional regulator
MYAASAAELGPGCRGRKQHHHHRGPRGWEDLIAFMKGPQGPFGDPRMFKAFFGGGPPWGGPGAHRGHRGPRRARRGDVRAAMLLLIENGPQNGYQIIQEIERRTDGVWKPSPGSVYPALQQLEDEGLVRAETEGGRRTYVLTDEGRAYVTEHGDEIAAPWAAMSEAAEGDDIRPLIGQIATAMWQIAADGTPEQQRRGREALADLRRRLHTILAEDETKE